MRNKFFVILSGEICAGKSTLGKNMEKNYGFISFHTRDILKTLLEKDQRKDLQKIGETLDKKTKGNWVRHYFLKECFHKNPNQDFFIIDSVRIDKQIIFFRESFGPHVVHVHLTCSPKTLLDRYINRNKIRDPKSEKSKIQQQYYKIKADPTEKHVDNLKDLADIVIDTDRLTEKDVFIKLAGFLGILGKLSTSCVDVVVGAQFGSEAKGQICAYLAPEYDALVRVGGPNAGHSVYSHPEPYVFHILPSGSIKSPNSKLLIGPGAVINIEILKEEIKKYHIDDVNRLVIDYNATIISNDDIKKESKLVKNIGSTGQGVGYATANNITNRCNENKNKAKYFDKELKGFLGSTHDELEKIYRSGGNILLEGTQGSFLSLHHGFYPYVTSRETTVSGNIAEAGISPKRVRKIILVTRTYPIRVESPSNATSGEFHSEELTWKEISKRSGISLLELENVERTSTTKRKRRVAEFSWHLFRKACELNTPTDIAITFVDYITEKNKKARRFDQLSRETIEFIDDLERVSEAPVSLISTRFDYRSIIDRRSWKFRHGC